MKIAFGMIVFEGDYVLEECLKAVYPFANQILIAEGPVKYWQDMGRTTSLDRTNDILNNFPDPDKKIKIVHGMFSEKDDQCRAYMEYIDEDVDYLWNLDSDEVYKSEDIAKIIEVLRKEQPTSVGVRSCSFYGGMDHYLTGFELNTDNFLRIFRYQKGATWLTHRPPTMKYTGNIELKHISSDTLMELTSAQMYHYSYVFPDQVFNKIAYYKSKVSRSNCIDNYFSRIYLPWVNGNDSQRANIENAFRGVHEFILQIRGDCFTERFLGEHPKVIMDNMATLKERFSAQLNKYNK